MTDGIGLESFDSADKRNATVVMLRHALYHLAMVAHQLEFTSSTAISDDEILQVALLNEVTEKLADRFVPELADHA